MQKAGYFKLGIFVIAAFSLGLIGLTVLGAGNLFQKSLYMETYFEESVQGLAIGSPVKYRGVKIGTVQTIDFVRNHYDLKSRTNRRQFGRHLLIRVNLPDGFGMTEGDHFKSDMQRMSEEGLRIRLAAQGLTGQAYLEVDFLDPTRFPALDVPWQPENVYLPAAPSKIAQLSLAVESFIEKLDQTEVQNIAHNLDRLLLVSANAIEDAEVPRMRNEFLLMLREIRQTNLQIQKVVGDPAFQNSPRELEKSLISMNRAMRRIDGVVAGNQDQINETIENMRTASRDLKEVTENAKRYPSYIFFGEPPRKSGKQE